MPIEFLILILFVHIFIEWIIIFRNILFNMECLKLWRITFLHCLPVLFKSGLIKAFLIVHIYRHKKKV